MLLFLGVIFCYFFYKGFRFLFIFAFPLCSCAVCLIGLVAVVPAHKL